MDLKINCTICPTNTNVYIFLWDMHLTEDFSITWPDKTTNKFGSPHLFGPNLRACLLPGTRIPEQYIGKKTEVAINIQNRYKLKRLTNWTLKALHLENKQ